MEAKDTVMRGFGHCQKELECQAELTWPIAKRAGIKKVVGWIQNHSSVMEFINMYYEEEWNEMVAD